MILEILLINKKIGSLFVDNPKLGTRIQSLRVKICL
jgi:hypothetical protein